jgi:hypothetical protein
MYDVLVENKEKGALGHKTNFVFKWIPSLTAATTPLGEATVEQKGNQGALKHVGPETTALIGLILAVSAPVGGGIWAAWKYLPINRLLTSIRI